MSAQGVVITRSTASETETPTRATKSSAPAEPGADGDVMADLNPASVEVLTDCLVEPALAAADQGEATAQSNLAYMALIGRGVPQDDMQAAVGLRIQPV